MMMMSITANKNTITSNLISNNPNRNNYTAIRTIPPTIKTRPKAKVNKNKNRNKKLAIKTRVITKVIIKVITNNISPINRCYHK